jgi:hypothetical protein
MAQPTVGAVHVDSALTNISVAYFQTADNFVAGRVFPNVPVAKQSDRYFILNKSDTMRSDSLKRAPGTAAARRGYGLDNTPTYFCEEYSIAIPTPYQVYSNADAAVDPDRIAAQLVMEDLLIDREKNWVNTFFTSGVWDNEETGVASSPASGETIQWSDQTSSDPIRDIREAKDTILETTGKRPNTLILQRRVMSALEDHADIVDRVKYANSTSDNPARVNEKTLAALFGVERIMVADGTQNTAAEGATGSYSFIAGKSALLCYVAPSPSLMTPSAGYTFSWSGYLGQTNAIGMATKRRDDDERGSIVVEGTMSYDQKVVASDLGYYFGSIVA